MGLRPDQLEALGYDPTAPYEISFETVCGAAIVGYVLACKGLPKSDEEIDSIVAQAQFDVTRRYGLAGEVSAEYIRSLISDTE